MQLPFCHLVSDCSVQCATGARNCEGLCVVNSLYPHNQLHTLPPSAHELYNIGVIYTWHKWIKEISVTSHSLVCVYAALRCYSGKCTVINKCDYVLLHHKEYVSHT